MAVEAGKFVSALVAGLGLAAAPVSGGGSLAVSAFAGIFASLGALASVMAAVLIIEGAFFAYVVPFIPSVIMGMAIIGWLVLVVEMLVAAPLWAAAHAYAGGEGFSPQQAQHGYAVVIGTIARPLLLTFGFVFAWLLIKVAGFLLGSLTMVYGQSLAGSTMGPIQFITLMGLLVGTWTAWVYFVMRLIVHLAQQVPQWFGGSGGADLGVDSTAQGALRESQGSYVKPALAGAAGLAAGSDKNDPGASSRMGSALGHSLRGRLGGSGGGNGPDSPGGDDPHSPGETAEIAPAANTGSEGSESSDSAASSDGGGSPLSRVLVTGKEGGLPPLKTPAPAANQRTQGALEETPALSRAVGNLPALG